MRREEGGGRQHKLGRDEDSNDDGLKMPFSCINVKTVKIAAPPCPLRYRFYCLWTDRKDRSIEPDKPPPSIQRKLCHHMGG